HYCAKARAGGLNRAERTSQSRQSLLFALHPNLQYAAITALINRAVSALHWPLENVAAQLLDPAVTKPESRSHAPSCLLYAVFAAVLAVAHRVVTTIERVAPIAHRLGIHR